MRKPNFVVCDPDMIKEMTIKDFDHFTDHNDIIGEHVDPVLGKILIFMKGLKWKSMRSMLSPIFTSSKMKLMFNILLEDCNDFTDYFKEEYKKNGRVVIEGKEIFSRFTMNGISHTVFGMSANCLRNKNEEIYVIGRSIIRQTFLNSLKLIFAHLFPKLYKFLGLKFLPKRVYEFGREITIDAIKYREENGIVRPDVLQQLIEAKKGSLKFEESQEEGMANFSANTEYTTDSSETKNHKWSDDEIIAQGLVFFTAGSVKIDKIFKSLGKIFFKI